MAEARKLLERATAYKEEAKRQHEKVGAGWQCWLLSLSDSASDEGEVEERNTGGGRED